MRKINCVIHKVEIYPAAPFQQLSWWFLGVGASSFVVRKVRDTAVRKPEPRSNQKMMGKGRGEARRLVRKTLFLLLAISPHRLLF